MQQQQVHVCTYYFEVVDFRLDPSCRAGFTTDSSLHYRAANTLFVVNWFAFPRISLYATFCGHHFAVSCRRATRKKLLRGSLS